MKSCRFLIYLFFTVLPVLPLASQASIPDNRETRLGLREVITAPTSDVLKAPDRVFAQFMDGLKVGFQIKQQNDSYYLLFINEKDGKFPTYSRGSYIIKRSLDDGTFAQVKIFLKDDPECFARIYPWEDRCRMEINLYGHIIYKDINLPLRFADILTASFSEIINVTGAAVDWEIILPENRAGLAAEKLELLSAVRKKLPLLNDVDDGAMDADGSYVYIEDLSPQQSPGGFNCSGFVKWIADGIYWGAAGRYLEINSLKSKKLDERGNRWSARHEDERDPYFGLDWTRNIAAAVDSAQSKGESLYGGMDVDYIPWSDYSENVGFPIEDLKLIMYYLAVKNPSYIFLASVNVPWGTAPVLRQHIHTAVLVPYIDEGGNYRDVVLERNIETDADSLSGRYPEAHVHLVRVRVDRGFRLPEPETRPSVGSENYFRR